MVEYLHVIRRNSLYLLGSRKNKSRCNPTDPKPRYYVNRLSAQPQEGFDDRINDLLTLVTGETGVKARARNVIDYIFENPETLSGVMNNPALLNGLWDNDGGSGTDPADVDDDGDGYTENQGDCNDAVASIMPGATEVCGDSIDQDCDGSDAVCAGNIQDANLQACVDETGLSPDQITELDCSSRNISSLSGIDNLINLEVLWLHDNQISDIAPLQNLDLLLLDISTNQISNLGPLQNMLRLDRLVTYENPIIDISALQNLTQLTSLDASYSQIENVTPLQGLINLTDLSLEFNQISDVSPLQNLTAMVNLFLRDNCIDDFSTVENLPNLVEFGTVPQNDNCPVDGNAVDDDGDGYCVGSP